jgi:hypothetical protein
MPIVHDSELISYRCGRYLMMYDTIDWYVQIQVVLPQKGLESLVTKYKAPLPLGLSALIPIIPHGCAAGPLSLAHFCKVE